MQTKMQKVAISKATAVDHFDFQLDTFCKAITMPTIEVVQDTLPPVEQGFDKGLKSFETAIFYTGDPTPQSRFSRLAVCQLIEATAEVFFEFVTGSQFWRSHQHPFELFSFFSSQVVAVSDQQPAAAFQGFQGRLFVRCDAR